jgi:hypothetical protein
MTSRKRLRLLPLCLLLSAISLFAQTRLDLSQNTKGNLPPARIVPGVAGQCLTTDISGNTVWATCASGGGGGYATIQNAAAAITQRAIINWVSNIVCSDNAGATRSDCNLASTISTAVINATTGFEVNGAAGAGKVLIGDGTNFVPGDPFVQGVHADGSTVADNPVVIGGYDTAGTPALHRATFINGTPGGTEYGFVTRNIPSGTQTVSGSVSVSNFPGTQTVSGTVAATQSGTWTVQPGNTANTTAWKVDGSAVTQPVSGTVTTSPPSNASTNVSQINGVTPLMGNGVTGTGSQRVTIASDNTAFSVNAAQSGTWTVQPGNTANTTAWKVDGSAVTQPVSGTVTANIGSSGSLALDASVSGLEVSQGSTTSGQKGVLIQGAVTTAAPTDTTAQTAPVSLTTSGAVRTDETSIAGTATLTGNGTTGAGSQRVTIASDNTAFTVNAAESGTWTVQPGNTPNSTPWLQQGNLSNNGAAASSNRIATLPAVAQTSYNNGTASTQGRDAALNVGTDGLLWSANLPAMRPASFVASATVTSAASATDIAVMPGNATNTALLTRVKVSCTQTTAGIITLNLIKRTTADSGGTSSGMTAVADDSNTSAAVSAPLTYTANPTINNTTGNVDTVRFGCMATGTTSANDIYILNRTQKPLVLRGTAQQIAVNLGGTTVTGGSFTITFEWIETSTITP